MQCQSAEQQTNTEEQQGATFWYSAAQNNPQNETWQDQFNQLKLTMKPYSMFSLNLKERQEMLWNETIFFFLPCQRCFHTIYTVVSILKCLMLQGELSQNQWARHFMVILNLYDFCITVKKPVLSGCFTNFWFLQLVHETVFRPVMEPTMTWWGKWARMKILESPTATSNPT